MAQRNVTAETVVYSAAIWWRDCDPMYNVVATTAKACEREAMRMLRGEARDAYDSEFDDPRTISDYLDDLCWSGVHQFTLSDLASGRELSEAIGDLNATGAAYLAQ